MALTLVANRLFFGPFLLLLSPASRNTQAFSGVSAAAQLSVLGMGSPAPTLKGQRQRSIERLSALATSLDRREFIAEENTRLLPITYVGVGIILSPRLQPLAWNVKMEALWSSG